MNEQRPRATRTAATGAPGADTPRSMRAGPRGPLLLQDYHLFERTARFNRARPPARAVHAKGAGAFGTFRVTGDITAYTKASLFAGVGTETPVLARFSNANGERGAADAERDLRGFALRFYTTAGNWDLIGSNSPVFFVRDPMAFPDAVRARARDPRSNLRDPAMQWDFWSSFPESLHQVTMLMSDRGLPRSYRHMNGYGGHTYAFINAEGERVWVKIHLKTQQGVQTMDADEAARVIGWDRDSHQRDLATAIAAGEHPKWTMYVQVMPVQDAQTVPYDPFDVTKVWPHGDYPLIEVGEIELNQRPDDHAAEVEQAAFQPANLVPGIGVSPDKMLQARLIAYADAQHDRLGVNHDRLPVNQPRRPAGTDDGGHASEHAAAFDEPPLPVGGTADRHGDGPANDDTTQAGNLFRLMTPEQQTRLINTIVTDMHGVPTAIQRRQIGHFYRADPAYGAGVARGLGIDLADAAE